jgi:membrane protein DedA with SNARE-associated domain
MSISDIVRWAEGIIESLGEIGVALVILIETVIPPIPSELLLPLAGKLVADGKFNFVTMLIAATIGSVAGATLLYGIARWAGERRVDRWIDRYGKWLLVTRDDMQRSRDWFGRHGNLTVLIARVIPGLRSLVSIPAGLASMPLGKFLLFTTIGSFAWNLILISAGVFLGSQYEIVEQWLDPISPVIYILVIGAVLFFVIKRLMDRRNAPSSGLRTED